MPDLQNIQDNIQLVRDLSNELAQFIHNLPQDVWRKAEQYPSGCEKWKVADVIAHQILGANTSALTVARALKGNTSPPVGYRNMEPKEATDRATWLRKAYDEDLFPEFNLSCRQLNTLLASLTPSDYELPAWQPEVPVPVWQLIEQRVVELAVHGWDVSYGFDRSAPISPKALPFLLGRSGRWFKESFQKGSLVTYPVRYRFELSDQLAASCDVAISEQMACLQPADGSVADVTFRCSADTYVLFAMGRLNFARAVRRGRLAFDGDQQLAARFSELFTSYQ